MISKDQVKHIAKLARLELTEKETEKMQHDLSAILDYFNVLKKVKSQKIKTTEKTVELEKVTREDKVGEKHPGEAGDLLRLAPSTKDGYIKVKNIF
ncbi:MAG: hypothetical protein A3A98_01705 [Candidatus Staskawiczbacteria bacterium RIFCSPLOWO2_01_FULL_40_39]|uniref:Aspartyl/glutamyl-tRNA(Asn/Gln) amidotransferase subunit C n=1 Tax=Candidatus Staskawiczbacteria bacterium RIFCSPHIGHO2_01_FULL_39_25 TaxID=1802202 RepID=A0A1G2HR31_9BACT|nr:MAG: hypothetical protein A2730_01860 [Candidatus Staskawiczbacteria bacterium RIFCSPHIGHO2_01_FULL_39_25]OGZ72688.1 MAG: hypothetical protein A3A98_01705 [Candidatus Staskawiczbacteria bacterium RIFCSPLOWO2_01_FULL_40_39]OGZ75556.1 MAG: hypothetical protein A3I87_02705 [Candidatus Staskawiczbacteria bacterium RIFCSPLOWO2_02_FULL_39_8]